jgi:RNA polymerase subunit RPABC4/transcription elongation factor Spt4
MKKKECPSCAMEIDANLKCCPVCNYEFPRTSNLLKWTALLLALLFLLFAVFF